MGALEGVEREDVEVVGIREERLVDVVDYSQPRP